MSDDLSVEAAYREVSERTDALLKRPTIVNKMLWRGAQRRFLEAMEKARVQ